MIMWDISPVQACTTDLGTGGAKHAIQHTKHHPGMHNLYYNIPLGPSTSRTEGE